MPDVYDFSSPKTERVKEELGGTLNPVERLDPLVITDQNNILAWQEVADKLNEVIALVNILAGREPKFPAKATRAISAQAEYVAPKQSTDNSNVGG